MTLSVLLTIYFLFLITYGALMWFAFDRVLLFARDKDLKGYCRRMSLTVLSLIVSIILVSFLFIKSYYWDDGFSYYCGVVSGKSCFCEFNREKRAECERQKNIAQEVENVKK